MSDDMSNRMTDEIRLRALMTAYQAGDLAAFEQLYTLVAPVLRRWLRGHARDAAAADDLVQETFLQIHRARHTYDPAFPVTPWAFAIARHVWLMHRRTLSRRPRSTDGVEAADLPVRATSEAYADRVAVRGALGRLPQGSRAALVWHHVFGFSFREIAARLGIRETAAKLRSSRGMAELRERLKRDHD